MPEEFDDHLDCSSAEDFPDDPDMWRHSMDEEE